MVRSIILGTAGHIDHGKSSLVKALTGIDPDRLKEEKERGITIDLGFANLAYPDGLTVGIVDVPGHERLIKNMLAGAGGIDMVLMVIAADEGIMPQSREHLSICELLKIKTGLIAVTKIDLVDKDWLGLIIEEIKDFVKGTFLDGSEIIPVSAKTGYNIELLRNKIRDIALSVEPKMIDGLFRLPIDRVFTLKGFGTVVTGTAISGKITVNSMVEILPSKMVSKVRGLQSHGKSTDVAYAGQRIGINLQGVEKESVKRGDVVVTANRFVPTNVIDAKLDILMDSPDIKNRSLVHFYSGTSETIARLILYEKEVVKAGESCYCQLRLDDPIVVLSGDRFIIRRFSPLETIGGGEILDPHPSKRRRKDGISDLEVLEKGSLKEKIEVKIKKSYYNGCAISDIEGWIQANIPEIKNSIEALIREEKIIKKGDLLFHQDNFSSFRQTVISILSDYHRNNPLKSGMPKEELRARFSINMNSFSELLNLVKGVTIEKDILRLADFSVSARLIDETIKEKVINILERSGFQPPFRSELANMLSIGEKDVTDILKLLSKEGIIVRINDSVYLSKNNYEKMIELLRRFFSKKAEMSVAEFRDMLNTSRKYALPILEYLDSNKITLRVGDMRKLMLK